MKHLCGFVWKIFGEKNFATILLYCGKKVSSSLFMKLRSIDILLAYCSTAYVTVCPASPGIVGAIGCVIAVLSDAFGCTSAPFASAKGRADVPSYFLPLTYNYAVKIGRAIRNAPSKNLARFK